LATCYPPAARRLAYLQLILAVGGLSGLVISHMWHIRPLLIIGGATYTVATLLPLPILKLLKQELS
jgi:hypothetical protein